MRSREGITALQDGGLMSRAKRKCWSFSVGVYGSRVRVTERIAGGPLTLMWLDQSGKLRKRALGHSDRKRGKDEALALANQISTDRESVEGEKLTLDRLFDIYERNGLHGRSEKHRREVKRKLALWVSF